MLTKRFIIVLVLFAFMVTGDNILQRLCPISSLSVPVLAYMVTTTPIAIRGNYRRTRTPALIHIKQYLQLQKHLQNIQLPSSFTTVTESNHDIVEESNINNTKSSIRGTIQILMSDTGGGHRASAYAIRDALEVLYPGGQIYCDIVDIYTEYGPIWPYNDYVSIYKYMAANPWMWEILYNFGKSDFGLWFNQIMLEIFCTDAFKECLCRLQPITCTTDTRQQQRRADMIVSVHPLTQDLPLKIVTQLDQMNRGTSHRTTPFFTVVTDLGSAHPTWFNPGYVVQNILVFLIYCFYYNAQIFLTYLLLITDLFVIFIIKLKCRQMLCTIGCIIQRCTPTGVTTKSNCTIWFTNTERILVAVNVLRK
jgi:hypothetical protein